MRLILAESNSFDPYFNLSFEKYLFDNVQDDELIFYLWQNERTVVVGRHQNIYKECNVTTLQSIGGKVARRLSGGGAVFHDKGNLNFTFIAKDENFDVERQLNTIVMALDQFGIRAEVSGRNDLTVLEKKFSGSAFRKSNGTSGHHGTIMINVDTLLLQNVLNVDKEKLLAHGVASVVSRTVNLHELSEDITVESMKIALKDAFLHEYKKELFDETMLVGGRDVISGTGKTGWSAAGSMLTMLKTLSETQKMFSSNDWLYGKNKEFTTTIESRFSWGDISINLVVDGETIKDVAIFSDCLFPSFIERLESELVDRLFVYHDLANCIDFAGAKFDDPSIKPIVEDIKKLIEKNI